MEEIQQIENFLAGADPNLVNLFFVKRDYKKRYTLLRTRINPNIGQQLMNIAVEQLKTLENAEIREYRGEDCDFPCVLKLPTQDVENLSQITDEFSRSDLQYFKKDDLDKIWGYVVRIQKEPEELLLFKKYPSKRVHLKRKYLSVGDKEIPGTVEGQLIQMPYAPVIISTEYDAATLTTKPLYVFSLFRFEKLFGYYEYYKDRVRHIEQEKPELHIENLLHDPASFINSCTKDNMQSRTMWRIAYFGELAGMTSPKMKKVITEYKLPLKLSEGKIVHDADSKQNLWTVLRLLNDDYVRSASTSIKYESRRKLKITSAPSTTTRV